MENKKICAHLKSKPRTRRLFAANKTIKTCKIIFNVCTNTICVGGGVGDPRVLPVQWPAHRHHQQHSPPHYAAVATNTGSVLTHIVIGLKWRGHYNWCTLDVYISTPRFNFGKENPDPTLNLRILWKHNPLFVWSRKPGKQNTYLLDKIKIIFT